MGRHHSDSRFKTYEADWGDPADLKQYLRENLFKGEVLNFPCGRSVLGDVQADADPDLDPQVVADVRDPPFPDQSFDTVYCDPPYSLYTNEDVRFILKLWDIARERLILQTPAIRLYIKGAEKRWFVNEAQGWGKAVLLFQVFDRPNRKLTEFGEADDRLEVASVK